MERELLKESLFNKLTLLASIGVNQENSAAFFKDYKSYLNMHFFMDDQVSSEETHLREEYEKIKNSKPKLLFENGVLKVKDLVI